MTSVRLDHAGTRDPGRFLAAARRAVALLALVAPAARAAAPVVAPPSVPVPVAAAAAVADPDTARGRFRLLLAPVHPTPVHESRWARDAGAALRRELSAIPWIEIVEPRPLAPGGRPREVADWPSAIGEARRLGCAAFLRTELKACTCEQRDETRNPWQGWITLEMKLDYVGDTPAAEVSDEDYVTGPWPEALEVRVPEMVSKLVAGLVPQILEGLWLGGHVVARVDPLHVLLDRGLADGVHVNARLTLVRPGREPGKTDTAAPVRIGELEVTSVAESTAVAAVRSGVPPVIGASWRWLPPRPVTGGSTIRGLVQSLGADDRCCP